MSNPDLTIKEAIAKCEENIRRNIESGWPLEVELWKKYRDQLETIGIILGVIEI